MGKQVKRKDKRRRNEGEDGRQGEGDDGITGKGKKWGRGGVGKT